MADEGWSRRNTDGRFVLLEARVGALESKQIEHRAILLGDGLEGKGGLRGELRRQNVILYGLLALALMAAPGHVKEAVAFFAKILGG